MMMEYWKEKPRQEIAVYRNQDFYEFQTIAIGMIGFSDPDAPSQFCGLDISDEELGRYIRRALNASRMLNMEEWQEIWRQKEKLKQKSDEKNKALMRQYGYKNKRDLARDMNSCWITLQDGKIKIQPTHHKSLEHYTGISKDGPEIQYVPEDISDAALGVAVKEGLRRCISSVK